MKLRSRHEPEERLRRQIGRFGGDFEAPVAYLLRTFEVRDRTEDSLGELHERLVAAGFVLDGQLRNLGDEDIVRISVPAHDGEGLRAWSEKSDDAPAPPLWVPVEAVTNGAKSGGSSAPAPEQAKVSGGDEPARAELARAEHELEAQRARIADLQESVLGLDSDLRQERELRAAAEERARALATDADGASEALEEHRGLIELEQTARRHERSEADHRLAVALARAELADQQRSELARRLETLAALEAERRETIAAREADIAQRDESLAGAARAIEAARDEVEAELRARIEAEEAVVAAHAEGDERVGAVTGRLEAELRKRLEAEQVLERTRAEVELAVARTGELEGTVESLQQAVERERESALRLAAEAERLQGLAERSDRAANEARDAAAHAREESLGARSEWEAERQQSRTLAERLEVAQRAHKEAETSFKDRERALKAELARASRRAEGADALARELTAVSSDLAETRAAAQEERAGRAAVEDRLAATRDHEAEARAELQERSTELDRRTEQLLDAERRIADARRDLENELRARMEVEQALERERGDAGGRMTEAARLEKRIATLFDQRMGAATRAESEADAVRRRIDDEIAEKGRRLAGIERRIGEAQDLLAELGAGALG